MLLVFTAIGWAVPASICRLASSGGRKNTRFFLFTGTSGILSPLTRTVVSAAQASHAYVKVTAAIDCAA